MGPGAAMGQQNTTRAQQPLGGPGDHMGARGPQWGPCTRDPNGIWDHNGARGSPWILGTTRELGNHNGAWNHNETAMGNRNTREPADHKGAQDHKGTWGHNEDHKGAQDHKGTWGHNEDHVPGTLVE